MNNKELLQYAQAKYDRGNKEHNNDLVDMPLKQKIKEALDECIDMMFYLNETLNDLNKNNK